MTLPDESAWSEIAYYEYTFITLEFKTQDSKQVSFYVALLSRTARTGATEVKLRGVNKVRPRSDKCSFCSGYRSEMYD